MSALDSKTKATLANTDSLGRQVSIDSIGKAEYGHHEVATANDGYVEPEGVDQFGASTVYSAEERSLVRKLDWHIMPIVFCMYFMNKLDQNAIANARLNKLEKDLGLVGNQFNICVSVLYCGYTLIQVSCTRAQSTLTPDPL